MSEWANRPRTLGMAGHRKATARFCSDCQAWHETPRGANPEYCEFLAQARAKPTQPDFPHVRVVPRTASR